MGSHVAAHVRWASVRGFVVLLDFRSETVHALDPTAASMWTATLEARDEADAVRGLAQLYDVEPSRLRDDFSAFVRRCVDVGFLQEEPPIASAPPRLPSAPPCRPSAPRAWWSLFTTVRSLSRRGFAQTYDAYARLASPPPCDDRRIERALAAFRGAENAFWMTRAPDECLPRSLALFHFLRRVGVRSEHCIGVRQFPLMVHAWVECNGHVVGDHPAHSRTFTVLSRIGV